MCTPLPVATPLALLLSLAPKPVGLLCALSTGYAQARKHSGSPGPLSIRCCSLPLAGVAACFGKRDRVWRSIEICSSAFTARCKLDLPVQLAVNSNRLLYVGSNAKPRQCLPLPKLLLLYYYYCYATTFPSGWNVCRIEENHRIVEAHRLLHCPRLTL